MVKTWLAVIVAIVVVAMVVGRAELTLAGGRPPALPVQAGAIVEKVAQAAKNGDLRTIREAMVPKFVWSFGGDEDADQAVDEWTKDPRYLRELRRVLRGRCRLRDATHVECPGRGHLNFRAGFVMSGAEWRFESFVDGD